MKLYTALISWARNNNTNRHAKRQSQKRTITATRGSKGTGGGEFGPGRIIEDNKEMDNELR